MLNCVVPFPVLANNGQISTINKQISYFYIFIVVLKANGVYSAYYYVYMFSQKLLF